MHTHTYSYSHACLVGKEFMVLSECRESLALRGKNLTFEGVSQCCASYLTLPFSCTVQRTWSLYTPAEQAALWQTGGTAKQFRHAAVIALLITYLDPLYTGSAVAPAPSCLMVSVNGNQWGQKYSCCVAILHWVHFLLALLNLKPGSLWSLGGQWDLANLYRQNQNGIYVGKCNGGARSWKLYPAPLNT